MHDNLSKTTLYVYIITITYKFVLKDRKATQFALIYHGRTKLETKANRPD